MSLFIKVLLSSEVSIIQILIVAYIGALIGEMQKEIDDEDKVVLLEFFVSWFSSGFIGTMIGMLLQGTVAKDNTYVVLGGTGVAGFMGRKKSLVMAKKLLLNVIKDIGSEEDDDEDDKPEKPKPKQKSNKKNKK